MFLGLGFRFWALIIGFRVVGLGFEVWLFWV